MKLYMKYKVLLISNNSEVVGGVERAVLNQMSSLVRVGIDTKLFAQSSIDSRLPQIMEYFKGSAVKKITNAINFVYRYESRIKLHYFIKSFDPDVIHVHSFEGGISNSMWSLLKNSRARVVFTLHDYGLVCGNHRLLNNGKICTKCINGSKFNIILNKCNRNNLAFSTVNFAHQKMLDLKKIDTIVDTFIAPSVFIKKIYLQKYPNWKIEVIANFSNHAYPPGKFSSPENRNRFMYFGRLSPEKGLYEFLVAICELNVDFKFTIVGAGDDSERLQRFQKDSRIRIMDKVNKIELDKLIMLHDWTVTPSIWYENFPYSIIESYEKLKPVLASNIGGMAEMVDEGKTGFTFNHLSKSEKQEAFIAAINCKEENYLVMQNNICEYLKEISEDKYLMKLFKVYGVDKN